MVIPQSVSCYSWFSKVGTGAEHLFALLFVTITVYNALLLLLPLLLFLLQDPRRHCFLRLVTLTFDLLITK